MPPSDPQIDQILDHVDTHLDEGLARLFDWLAIPSISTDPAYTAQCHSAADWLSGQLADLGFDAAVRPTGGNPMVTGHSRKPDAPHLLFYGHYDVQPVDPLDQWISDPFAAELRTDDDGEKRIYARGASDDKGQVMTFVEACRAYKAVTGDLPVGISFLIEGEEESASANFAPFVKANADEFRADAALACDTGLWGTQTPCIFTALRGMVAEELTITCAARDLHSGLYGSAARNPNQVMAEIIASLRNPDGSVAIEGFYDDVREVPQGVRDSWDKLDFDADQFMADAGLSTPAGEKDRSVFEQVNSRPTCEINGMTGGYAGPGFKTVIPAKCTAKISFRLVADQDPARVQAAFRTHVRDRLPPDCAAEFTNHGVGSAVSVPMEGPYIRRASQALETEWGKPPVLRGGGGSIPAVESIKTIIGLDTLMIGFARDDDRVHSPNEKYDLKSFHKGIRSWVRILAALAERD